MKKVFWITIGLLSTLMAQEQSIEQKTACSYISKEESIFILTRSNVFKNAVKQYPANTKFAFPFEMITLHEGKKCSVEISAYVDEDDHFTLIGSFLVKGGEHMNVSQIK